MPSIIAFESRHESAVLALIGGVFAEYGLTFDPAGYDADLTRIATAYPGKGGAFWVLEEGGRIVGTVAPAAMNSRARATASPFIASGRNCIERSISAGSRPISLQY